MKFINKLSKIVTASALVVLAGSCSMFDLDINKDPNNPTVASPSLLLPQIEVDIMSNFAGVEGDLESYMGIMGTQSLSRWDLQTTQYDGTWQSLYRGPLKDLEQLIEATSTGNNPHYLGIAQTLKAYTYGTMVDLWGDIPFTEASKADAASAVKAPKFDKDADIYTAVIKLLDDAIANFAKTSAVAVSGDVIYGGNAARWSRLAKTLKLKFLITGRKGISGADAQIKTLASESGFISGAADDFKFTFSKDPTSVRHPWYTGAYTGGGFDYTYICHQIILDMHLDLDPRTRFYFRNQTIRRLNENDVTERNTASVGYLPWTAWRDSLRTRGWDSTYINGLFGRERGDAGGIPADEQLRLIPGVYPCGGFYNTNLTASTTPTANAAPGGGIFPAVTEVNLLYYRIEAILALGATGDAKALFETAIRTHIGRVVDFGRATDANSVAPTTAAIDAYVNLWKARYDAATSNEAKLNVVMKQLWISSWGNGFEIYNAYRRTGYPNTLKDPINPSPKGATSFIWRMPYPNSELNLNASITAEQKAYKYWINKIFWTK
ncbi:MAG: SusD/RagB family nutrient-binding outer membrane lipoprotein [Saprospiraceae bacterium]|nr:SusD/RagB family nutrient-binding outer membrane lipoprotein [Saprospiraceae bacterium]